MFIRKRGKTKLEYYPVTPSTAISAGALVVFSSGKLIPATSSTNGSATVGVLRHTIAATDSDYANDRLVEVEVPIEQDVVWEVDFTSGLVATDIGNYVDLTDSLTVNRGASAKGIVSIVGVISPTKGRVILNIGYKFVS